MITSIIALFAIYGLVVFILFFKEFYQRLNELIKRDEDSYLDF